MTLGAAQDVDSLYADRANPASAQQAADLLAAAVASDAHAFVPAWKLARITYWLGTHGPAAGRRAALERGIAAARQAALDEPDKPEGHFWLAANMGALAESFGLRAGLKYRKAIRESLERVLAIDPAFMQGSADRALGRWYHQVPRLFGGNNATAETHLRASLRYNPTSTITHYFLAELFADQQRLAEARSEWQAVLDAPLSAEWAPEDEDYKARARARLAQGR